MTCHRQAWPLRRKPLPQRSTASLSLGALLALVLLPYAADGQCVAGRFSTDGQFSCSDCSAGSYSVSGATACTFCSAGRYSSSAGSSSWYAVTQCCCLSCVFHSPDNIRTFLLLFSYLPVAFHPYPTAPRVVSAATLPLLDQRLVPFAAQATTNLDLAEAVAL